MQRLFADTVARQEEPALAPIPDREGEHPAEPFDALFAFVLVKMDDGFGVTARAQLVAPRDQQTAKFAVVVYFAVEDDPDRTVFVRDRLAPRGQIDNREPAHAHRDVGL